MERIAQASLRSSGRITGAVYLLYFLTAIASELLVHQLALYNAANLFSTACYAVVVLLFYYMFKPVNGGRALLAMFFGLAGCAITALSLFQVAPFNINPLVFFGLFNLLIGYLIFGSTFLPRILGVLMALSGLGWLIYLSALATPVTTLIEILGIGAEGSLMLWLLVFGLNVQRWKEQAGAAPATALNS